MNIKEVSYNLLYVKEIKKIINPAKEYYYKVTYDFLKRKFVQSQEFDYIITKTLDDYILAQAFLIILISEYPNDDVFYTAANKLRNNIFSNVLSFNNKNIKVCVLDIKKPSDIANQKLLLNDIMMLTQLLKLSYSSFNDSFKCPDSFIPSNYFDYCIHNTKSSVQTNANIEMQVFFESHSQNLSNVNKCMRYYTHQDNSKTAIPFVNLPMMLLNDWRSIYKKIPLFSKEDSENETFDITAYKFISDFASYLYANKFELNETITNNLLCSFNFDVTSPDNNSNIQSIIKILDDVEHTDLIKDIDNNNALSGENIRFLPDCNIDSYEREVDLLSNINSVVIWCNILKSYHREKIMTSKKLHNMITEFLDLLYKKNEKNTNNNMPLLQGIPMYALFISLQYYNKAYDWGLRKIDLMDFYSYIMSLCDAGIALYNVDIFTFNRNKYISGCITSGKQAYHALMEPDSAAEVFAIHLLRFYTHNSAEFHHKLQELIDINQLLDSQRLKYVGSYYEANNSLTELIQLYPTSNSQREILREYVISLCQTGI